MSNCSGKRRRLQSAGVRGWGLSFGLVLWVAAACGGAGGAAVQSAAESPRPMPEDIRAVDTSPWVIASESRREEVRTGIDVLAASGFEILAGKRVGLITNHTGRDRKGKSTIDLLHDAPGAQLVALFGPEHGIRGEAEAGERVASGRDARTGLPIHSLYGATRKPTPEMLAGLDVLVFDIQDIGARYYTYVWTMALAMRAAAEVGLEFVVLDRPNPLGGVVVQGNVLDPAYSSFVGLYPVPMRHGLTAGELARLLNEEHGIGVKLTVVPVSGWRRDLWYDETGLPWTPPSPNIPLLESALHYPGTCLFEGTNLSVGRGTDAAFQQIGAPWLDAETLATRLNALELPGVRFEAIDFTPIAPGDGKFGGERVRGVRFIATNRERYDPTRAAIAALVEIRRLHPDRLSWRESHFDRLAGTDRLRRGIIAGASVAELTAGWDAAIHEFEDKRSAYLLYR